MTIGTQLFSGNTFARRLMQVLVSGLFVAGLIAGVSGCGKKQISPPKIKFTIKSQDDTNAGRPFYIAIRNVNANQFLTDTYQGVAEKIFSDPPSPSVLAAQAVVPGEKLKIKVLKPDQNDVGIYCFFTDPSDPWKILLQQPLADKYKILLDVNKIKQSEKDLEKK
jgi:hypothetical protein